MNAIQYFEWGGEGKKIHYCRIRAKNLFNSQEWHDIKSFFPFRVGYIGKIVYTTLGNDNISVQIRKPKVFIEENDLVWDVFVRENINEMRTLKVINFQVDFNVNYLNGFFYKWGSAFINNRKVKTSNTKASIANRTKLIEFSIPSWNNEGIVYEDNSEIVTIPGLLGKEIVLELN